MVRREEDLEVRSFKKLITLLSDGLFYSEANLIEALKLSQSALQKLIQYFPDWDIPLDSTDKGYRIPNGLSLLDKDKIQAYFPTLDPPLPIEIWDSLPSTNDYLIQQSCDIQQNLDQTSARCCIAERQTQGKGRRGKQWVSPFARNIYLSLLWPFSHTFNELSTISLVVAIGLVRSLQSLNLPPGLGLKWPNDVFWKDKKLAGILIELSSRTQINRNQTIRSAVIGIGLNVEMRNLPDPTTTTITQAWTDLAQISCKTRLDRNQIAGRLLNELIQSLQRFEEHGFSPFKKTWQALDLTLNKRISILTATQVFQGVGRGINEQGHILLELESGKVKAFASGEVSVSLASSLI